MAVAYDAENASGLQRGRHAWKQQGPLEILQDQRRVNQIEGLALEHDVSQIRAPDVKLKARIRKLFAKPKQIRWIQVETEHVGGYLRVHVLQSIACRTAEHEHRPRFNGLQNIAHESTEHRPLIDGRTAHVTDIVAFWNVKPRIVHLRAVCSDSETHCHSAASGAKRTPNQSGAPAPIVGCSGMLADVPVTALSATRPPRENNTRPSRLHRSVR